MCDTASPNLSAHELMRKREACALT